MAVTATEFLLPVSLSAATGAVPRSRLRALCGQPAAVSLGGTATHVISLAAKALPVVEPTWAGWG